jgi:hypothetical protein
LPSSTPTLIKINKSNLFFKKIKEKKNMFGTPVFSQPYAPRLCLFLKKIVRVHSHPALFGCATPPLGLVFGREAVAAERPHRGGDARVSGGGARDWRGARRRAGP